MNDLGWYSFARSYKIKAQLLPWVKNQVGAGEESCEGSSILYFVNLFSIFKK